MEVLGEGWAGHQRHCVAREQPHSASGSSREVPPQDHLPGRTTLHQSDSPRHHHGEVQYEQGCPVPSSQGGRNGKVSITES